MLLSVSGVRNYRSVIRCRSQEFMNALNCIKLCFDRCYTARKWHTVDLLFYHTIPFALLFYPLFHSSEEHKCEKTHIMEKM